MDIDAIPIVWCETSLPYYGLACRDGNKRVYELTFNSSYTKF